MLSKAAFEPRPDNLFTFSHDASTGWFDDQSHAYGDLLNDWFQLQGPPPQGPLKFTIADTLERIKEEFNFLQAQYHS